MNASASLSIDAQCHEWAAEAGDLCRWIVTARQRVKLQTGVPVSNRAFWGAYLRRDNPRVVDLADRIIAARTQQAAETAEGGAL